jgi:hypothetical protein
MADSRDILGKNRKFKGTSGVVMPKGSTAERADTESGEIRFNTTTELMEYYDGSQWKPIDAPPTISSISTSDATGDDAVLVADGSSLFTVTITGGNFGIGLNVKFIGNTGTEYTAGNINRVSNSSITCTTLSSMGTSDDPYDVQVTNASGLSALLEDALSFNAPPVFVNASGQIGTVYDTQVISGSTIDASATDAEADTITYSIVSGSLPGTGLSLSSSTGYITGTLGGTPSLGNYPFVVRAATSEGFAERQFSIQVDPFPFVSATGGTITTSGNYKIHTFTGPGTFTVTNAGSPAGSNVVDYLVVAGGGSGGHDVGGGGGAGGFRESKSAINASPHSASPLVNPVGVTVTAQGYPITVGAGGSGDAIPSNSGAPSVFATITSAGGGSGGDYSGGNGSPGGSGGGGSGYNSFGSGGTGNSPPVSPPQGNNGGSGWPGGNPTGTGGGGGGATQVGGTGISNNAGLTPFANGATTSINNSPTTYSRGGRGAGDGATGMVAGSANTGDGGDARGSGGPGGLSGGSGIVILRYKYQ